MTDFGWEKLWRENAELARWWQELPPIPQVVEMADRLQAAGRTRVLDIGCGMGRHLLYLAARGFAVTGIDNSPTSLAKCHELLGKADLQASVMEAEMAALPFAGESFDGVVATNVIHHVYLATLKQIIADVWRMLAPGGYFVWVTPMPDHFEYGKGEEVEPGTFVNPEHREGPAPHHYCSEEEARELLSQFELRDFEKVVHETVDRRYSHWRILAQKPEGVKYDVPPATEPRRQHA